VPKGIEDETFQQLSRANMPPMPHMGGGGGRGGGRGEGGRGGRGGGGFDGGDERWQSGRMPSGESSARCLLTNETLCLLSLCAYPHRRLLPALTLPCSCFAPARLQAPCLAPRLACAVTPACCASLLGAREVRLQGLRFGYSGVRAAWPTSGSAAVLLLFPFSLASPLPPSPLPSTTPALPCRRGRRV
jgi:hypothetical protein